MGDTEYFTFNDTLYLIRSADIAYLDSLLIENEKLVSEISLSSKSVQKRGIDIEYVIDIVPNGNYFFTFVTILDRTGKTLLIRLGDTNAPINDKQKMNLERDGLRIEYDVKEDDPALVKSNFTIKIKKNAIDPQNSWRNY